MMCTLSASADHPDEGEDADDGGDSDVKGGDCDDDDGQGGEGELHKNCSTDICSPDPHQCGKHQYPEI